MKYRGCDKNGSQEQPMQFIARRKEHIAVHIIDKEFALTN